MALQMPCHNSHQIFGVVGLHHFFLCPLKDLRSIGFSHFLHNFEVGIRFQIFRHKVTFLMLQHKLKGTHLQIRRLWSHEVTGFSAVA